MTAAWASDIFRHSPFVLIRIAFLCPWTGSVWQPPVKNSSARLSLIHPNPSGYREEMTVAESPKASGSRSPGLVSCVKGEKVKLHHRVIVSTEPMAQTALTSWVYI